MKKFETGKEYRVNNGDVIKVVKRTAYYIYYSGDRTGKSRIHACFDSGLFGMGENIWIPLEKNISVICMAAKEIEE